jgi:hypothetical protein
MDIDAALTLISFAAFVVLFVSWILSPLRAAAPASEPAVAVPPPTAAVAA